MFLPLRIFEDPSDIHYISESHDHHPKRSQRIRQTPHSSKDYEVYFDISFNVEGELVHCILPFFAESEPVGQEETSQSIRWRNN